ncbi:MAG: hypothetical protein NDI82_02290 [Anaeromyxobacteraceae bacterium]|nr:hypothetical protein [Anaeromyxobacteraceae bacterium]
MATEYPLKLRIEAIDKATAPLRALNAKMRAFTEPVRKLNNSLRAFSDEAGLPRLTKVTGGLGRAIGDVGSEAMALGLKLAGMAAGAAVGFYAIVRQAVDAGDELGEMAQRVGLSVDAFAQMQYAAAQADVEQEAFNGAMDQFNKRLGELKAGGGPLLAFLNQVAPGLAQQMKAAKGTEEAMGLLTQAFEKLQDPAKIAALSGAAFGKSGLQMGQWLHQGTRALEEQRAEFSRIAGSQEEFARRAGLLDNAMRRTGTAMGALRNGSMAKLFPALTKLSEALTALIVKHADRVLAFFEGVGKSIGDWVDGGGVEKLADQIGSLIDQVRDIVSWMGGWKNVLLVVGAVMAGPLIASLVSLTSATYSFGLALLTTPVGWFLLAAAAIAAAVYTVVSNWDSIKTFFSDLFDGVKGIFTGFSDFVFGILIGDMGKAWDGLKSIFKSGLKFVATMADGLLAILRIALAPLFKMMEWAGLKTGDFSFRQTFGVDGGPAGALNPAAALPLVHSGTAGSAQFTMRFENVPRGARLTETASDGVDLDLSLGYSMFGP